MTANPARVAIVHYHSRPGGVTSVMRNQQAVLEQLGLRSIILTGNSPPGWDGICTVEGLDYTGKQIPANLLKRRLQSAARKALGGPPEIWHFHNHSLGKNPSLSSAVHQMALDGQRILLQIHDFAEDGRPANYRHLLNTIANHDPAALAAILYPQGPNVDYAVLSHRDHALLIQAGFDPAHIHVLPNPVPEMPDAATPSAAAESTLFLYPTRALRRKNIGELLLWSAAAAPGDFFGTTLAPTSQGDLRSYEHWKQLAARLQLPVQFELGITSRIRFPQLVRTSRAIITTSIAEGFGMAFLEPWIMGRPLVGRNLPELTREFETTGLNLSSLYEHLWTPISWMRKGALERALSLHLPAFWHAYGRPLPPDAAARALDSMTQDDLVDFGKIGEPLQESIICKVKGSRELRQRLSPHQPWNTFPEPEVVRHNRRIIRRQYGIASHGKRLGILYDRLLRCLPGRLSAPSHEAMLNAFLAPERFSLLRT